VNIDVAVALNGRVFCRGNTSSMDWTFPEVIAFASRGTEVRPGDVFGSGTLPTGCLLEHFSMTGSADFPGWLWDGDVVEFSSEILGTTRQVVRSSPVPAPLPQRRRPSDRQRPARRNPAGDYARGLQDLGSEAWAWLLPDGGYGWSNAGLVSGADASLLIDTLFDLHLTAEMLAAMDPITSLRPITHAVLTHSNGDHIHGNQLLADSVAIVAAKGTAEEFHEMVQPSMLSGMLAMDMGPQLTRYLRDRFGPFEFAGIKVREPDLTFDDRLTLDVGGREVHVLNLGPAHTAADSVVHVPDAGILYAGDLLFVGCTPVVWSGPIANWIAACDRMIAMAPSVVVPGHGPLTDVTGIRGVRDYLSFVSQQATEAFETGIGFADAARGVDLGPYRDWLDSERVVVNFYQRYRELDPTLPALDVMALLGLAAQWEAEHGR
jgi:glyoxylase-like metal-dependent hydrolase (beta-lactamase superfamily II)